MKPIFKKGDIKKYTHTITSNDIAAFEAGIVHELYSTFALCRDAEWSGRLFVLDMKEDDEEGIGTMIQIKHLSPAFVGETVEFEAEFDCITDKNEIINQFRVTCNQRLIAVGTQGQKILKKDKIKSLFEKL
ncbi:MAG: hypothetical protein IT215_04880 [Chitinophagaceae bacterium]|nr:MAG: hypothetical protein UZ11_BCD004001249 [Bacteroidetes bacterium OLB11]MCC6448000.1 hypothetical protein [Chitinophagaceae bacterium]HMN32083.1 hypothetical protein [Chitinophagaceae bacterium]